MSVSIRRSFGYEPNGFPLPQSATIYMYRLSLNCFLNIFKDISTIQY